MRRRRTTTLVAAGGVAAAAALAVTASVLTGTVFSANADSTSPSGGNSNWGSGYLPTVYQGVPFRTSGDPVLSVHEV